MARATLFIKTDRVPVVRYEMPNTMGGGHWCSAAYRTQSTLTALSPQDRQAKEILARSGLPFEIVDLSAQAGRRLAARLRGVKETPTLLVQGRPSRKYEGVKAISEYANRAKNPQSS